MMHSFEDILEAAKRGGRKKMVVPRPVAADFPVLAQASAAGLIRPFFVGNGGTLKALAGGSFPSEGEYEILEENDPQQVLGRALAAVRDGAGETSSRRAASPPKISSTRFATRMRVFFRRAAASATFPFSPS